MAEINIEEYKGLRDAMASAEDSMRPFVVPADGGEIVVAGDVNNTETNPKDFTIVFRVPKVNEDGSVETSYREVVYKNVFVTPRQDLKIVQAVADLMPFVKKVKEDGGIENYNDEELMQLINSLSDSLIDRIYNVVASILGIDEQLKDYIEFGSALNVLGSFFQSFPGNGK